jgi:hypothetical protein
VTVREPNDNDAQTARVSDAGFRRILPGVSFGPGLRQGTDRFPPTCLLATGTGLD